MDAVPSSVDGMDETPGPADEAKRDGTPRKWRFVIIVVVLGCAAASYGFQSVVGPRWRAGCGLICFLGIIGAASSNLRAVNCRTIAWGMFLQLFLAMFIIKFEIFGVRPGYQFFLGIADVTKKFLQCGDIGARFVLGPLADPDAMEPIFPQRGLVFAFTVLPTIIFVSAFFSLLNYLGIVQFLVWLTSRAMRHLMRTSGAETLAVVENVFMGQSESPLLVRPYVAHMTSSEILALMTAGMSTISGGMIAVYIGMGVDPVAVLAASVMSAPCSLIVAKLLLPETMQPETAGDVHPAQARDYVNALDAIAGGATAGLKLALNVAAMLIAFLAFIALMDGLLQAVFPSLSLRTIFSALFAPFAWLLGVSGDEVPLVADLLGTKLVANEFVAYAQLTGPDRSLLSPRAFTLASYALAGFANFSSVGIQLGALGTIAPNRRHDFARLGYVALFGGFVATLINAAIAGMLMDDS